MTFITNYKKSLNNLKVFLNPTRVEKCSQGTVNVDFTPVLTCPAVITYSDCAGSCQLIDVMSFITEAQYLILFIKIY